MSDLVTKLDNMSKMGYRVMTVAELASHLAGLPPMMEVFIDADGASMYLNDVEMQEATGYPPFLRLIGNERPIAAKVDGRPYQEKLDEQKQRAMAMGEAIDRESRMHRRVH